MAKLLNMHNKTLTPDGPGGTGLRPAADAVGPGSLRWGADFAGSRLAGITGPEGSKR